MIREVFGKMRKPLGEVILQAMSELGKHHARLEMTYLKLDKRNKELFDACSSCLSKGLKAKATIYANEISEIRKIMSTLGNAQLAVERAILRLETLKTVSPTLEELKGVFSDVKNALGLMANAMPSLTPELANLNNAVNELIDATQFTLESREPVVVKDEYTEAILQEASDFLAQELQKKIPEPPIEPALREPEKVTKPMIALAADGSELYFNDKNVVIEDGGAFISYEAPSSLSEELILDYIERNHGNMNIAKCAKELNMAPAKVLESLEALSKNGKIKIER
ncbi:MAG: hypothetical protein QXX08_05520 [Candidatus Bathyarchaeia archaeon]